EQTSGGLPEWSKGAGCKPAGFTPTLVQVHHPPLVPSSKHRLLNPIAPPPSGALEIFHLSFHSLFAPRGLAGRQQTLKRLRPWPRSPTANTVGRGSSSVGRASAFQAERRE